MHPALKILVGAVMIVVGVYSSVTFWPELISLVKAGIGPFLVVVGAFIVWLESDELKMQRQQDQESVQQQFQQAEAVSDEISDDDIEVEDETEEGFTCHCGKTFDTERGLHIHQAQKHE